MMHRRRVVVILVIGALIGMWLAYLQERADACNGVLVQRVEFPYTIACVWELRDMGV